MKRKRENRALSCEITRAPSESVSPSSVGQVAKTRIETFLGELAGLQREADEMVVECVEESLGGGGRRRVDGSRGGIL